MCWREMGEGGGGVGRAVPSHLPWMDGEFWAIGVSCRRSDCTACAVEGTVSFRHWWTWIGVIVLTVCEVSPMALLCPCMGCFDM